MGASYTKKLEKSYLDLTLTAKHMVRESKKREQEAAKARKQVELYMKKNEMEVAKIHAENCIRKKNESVKFLRLSARLDAVAQRVKSALSQHQLSESMKNVVASLDGVLGSMDVEKISKTMEQFESQFETLDVRTKFMDSSIANTTASSTPQEEVTGLMNEVGETIGIQVSEELDNDGVPLSMPLNSNMEVENEQPESVGVANSSSSNTNSKNDGPDTGSNGNINEANSDNKKKPAAGGGLSDLEARFNRLKDN